MFGLTLPASQLDQAALGTVAAALAAEGMGISARPDLPISFNQVLTTGGTLKGEVAFAGNTGPVTIPNAELVAPLGAETDFKLRAFYSWAGLRSLNFDEITVLKGA